MAATKLKEIFRGDIEGVAIAGEQDPFFYGDESGNDGSLRKYNPGWNVARGVKFMTGELVRMALRSFVIGVNICMSTDNAAMICFGSNPKVRKVGRAISRHTELQDQQKAGQNIYRLMEVNHHNHPACGFIHKTMGNLRRSIAPMGGEGLDAGQYYFNPSLLSAAVPQQIGLLDVSDLCQESAGTA